MPSSLNHGARDDEGGGLARLSEIAPRIGHPHDGQLVRPSPPAREEGIRTNDRNDTHELPLGRRPQRPGKAKTAFKNRKAG